MYKPTPIKNGEGKLLCIIGNMFNEGSSPAIVKINSNEVGSCFAIWNFENVLKEFRPEIPLQANIVKETNRDKALTKIAVIAIPTLVPLPFGKETEATIFNEHFAEEMSNISSEHGFWENSMTNIIK